MIVGLESGYMKDRYHEGFSDACKEWRERIEDIKKDHMDNWCKEDETNALQLIDDIFNDILQIE